MKIERRELGGGDLMIRADTLYGKVMFAIVREERAELGDRLDRVIESRALNAEYSLRNRRTDAEWLAETVGADG